MSAAPHTGAIVRLEDRIDKNITSGIAVSGGLQFKTATEAMEAAKMMATGGIAIRKHCRGAVGVCLALIIQGNEWGVNPISLSNKSYVVNDQLCYESSVLQAVVQKRAPIKGRIKTRYDGAGDARTCTVSAITIDEPPETVEYTSPPVGKISPKNSPLWRTDPDQQLHYYSVRAWCRRHFPDVLLGVYADDELEPHSMVTASGQQAPAPVATAPAAYDIIDADTPTRASEPEQTAEQAAQAVAELEAIGSGHPATASTGNQPAAPTGSQTPPVIGSPTVAGGTTTTQEQGIPAPGTTSEPTSGTEAGAGVPVSDPSAAEQWAINTMDRGPKAITNALRSMKPAFIQPAKDKAGVKGKVSDLKDAPTMQKFLTAYAELDKDLTKGKP